LKNIFAISEMGNLPQGAPTSPCLSNLACLSLDEALEELANKMGLRYSRYSDDITFSSQSINFKRGDACKVIAEACNFLAMHGFKPNRAKTDIIPPGAKKIVLGLNVDKSNVTLDKNFKNNIKQHIHFCLHEEIGPVKHARKRKFSSVIGFRNHLQGLIAYAKSIEPVFGDKMDKAFKCIKWPF
ncbi:TPA: reverse transcriptase domain-containing protein, partial [Serratia fonticola]